MIHEGKRAAPFSSLPGFGPLCRLLFPQRHSFCDCVCAHCVFRLISLTLSCSDEAGQITLSAQPTQPVQNEEREPQPTVFSTVSCLAAVNVKTLTYSQIFFIIFIVQRMERLADPLTSNSLYCQFALNQLCRVVSCKCAI